MSVCLPTYNEAAYLRESLASILAQTYPHIQVLVSDDASDDDTPQVVAGFADTRIDYVRNPANLGQFENVNRALARAAGAYVAIYHSDDVYEPTIVEREVGFLESRPGVGAVFALDRWIDARGRVFGASRLPPGVRGGEPLGLEEVVEFLLRNRNRLLRAPTFMARAEVLAQAGPFDTSRYEIAGDLDMWLRILERRSVAILDEHLMRYRSEPGQVSARYNALRTAEEDFFAVMDDALARDGLRFRIDRAALEEYAFLRCDDETFRAANMVIVGDRARALGLLRRRHPWRPVLRGPSLRKARVLALRGIMRAGLVLRADALLARLLARFEYGGRLPGATSS